MFTKRAEAHANDSYSPPTLDMEVARPKREPRMLSARPSARSSVIGKELTLTGNVTSKGSVHVDGRIDGDVHCAELTTGEDALISGGIQARDVTVNGEVRGNIRAEHVTLQPKARVLGDIHHQTLAVMQGAQFEGWARRADKKEVSSIEAKLRATADAKPQVQAGPQFEPVVLDAGRLTELPNPTDASIEQAGEAERPEDGVPAPRPVPNGRDDMEKPGPLH